jgi:potassium channel subfamily K
VVTFTTIGYGDVVPVTSASRLFTCFFALTGVATLGVALGVIGNSVIEAQSAALEEARKLSRQRALSLFKPPSDEEAATAERNSSSNNVAEEEEGSLQLASTGVSLQHIGLEFVAVIALSLLFATLLSHDPGISSSGWRHLGDAAYFGVISATTVGYGDLAPASQRGRLLATIFIPITVAAMGHWLSLVAGYIIDSRQSRFREQMANKELTLEDLDVMDEDGDGQVTQVEFLEFMLTAMNKVDQETLQNLRAYFRRLDTDGTGTLSKEDLIAAARRKLKMTKQKLELSSYKRSLLKTASEASPDAKEEEKESLWNRFAV